MVFPTVKISAGTDAMQFADIQFFNVTGDFNEDDDWDCTTSTHWWPNRGRQQYGFVRHDHRWVGDQADLDFWLVIGGAANFLVTAGNPFLVGDANLDGIVNEIDFAAWNSNKFTATAAWCSGDFNADGFVRWPGFLLWNANKFNSSAAGMPFRNPIGLWHARLCCWHPATRPEIANWPAWPALQLCLMIARSKIVLLRTDTAVRRQLHTTTATKRHA